MVLINKIKMKRDKMAATRKYYHPFTDVSMFSKSNFVQLLKEFGVPKPFFNSIIYDDTTNETVLIVETQEQDIIDFLRSHPAVESVETVRENDGEISCVRVKFMRMYTMDHRDVAGSIDKDMNEFFANRVPKRIAYYLSKFNINGNELKELGIQHRLIDDQIGWIYYAIPKETPENN